MGFGSVTNGLERLTQLGVDGGWWDRMRCDIGLFNTALAVALRQVDTETIGLGPYSVTVDYTIPLSEKVVHLQPDLLAGALALPPTVERGDKGPVELYLLSLHMYMSPQRLQAELDRRQLLSANLDEGAAFFTQHYSDYKRTVAPLCGNPLVHVLGEFRHPHKPPYLIMDYSDKPYLQVSTGRKKSYRNFFRGSWFLVKRRCAVGE
jgi:hypothetical protein